MKNTDRNATEQHAKDETKKNILDRLEGIFDDASSRIMEEAGEVQDRLEAVADDVEEVVSEQIFMMKERVREAVEYAEDSIEEVTLRREVAKLEDQLDIAYQKAGRKMWRLHRSNELGTAEQACVREIDRIKKLQERISKKKKALKLLT